MVTKASAASDVTLMRLSGRSVCEAVYGAGPRLWSAAVVVRPFNALASADVALARGEDWEGPKHAPTPQKAYVSSLLLVDLDSVFDASAGRLETCRGINRKQSSVKFHGRVEGCFVLRVFQHQTADAATPRYRLQHKSYRRCHLRRHYRHLS